MKPRFHYWEIDALKGLALLGVLAIHAKLFEGTFVYEALIDRAVPILVILFGVTSELSWRSRSDRSAAHTIREYWWSRLVRLMPPVWVAVGLWWILVYSLQYPAPSPWPWLLANAAGYLPHIGTSWFITLILQLVVLAPLLHFALLRAPAVSLAIALGLMTWSHLASLDIIAWMRALFRDSAPANGFFAFYYFWIFAPRALFPVLAGMSLARSDMRVSRRLMFVFVALLVAGMLAQRTLLTHSMQRNALAALLDVPLTVVLLALLRAGCPQSCAHVLGWLGRGSWSVYLGQLVVHNALDPIWKDAVGESLAARLLYFACLLAGGLLWIVAEQSLRRRLAQPTDSSGAGTSPPLETLEPSNAAARSRNG